MFNQISFGLTPTACMAIKELRLMHEHKEVILDCLHRFPIGVEGGGVKAFCSPAHTQGIWVTSGRDRESCKNLNQQETSSHGC